MLLFLAPNAVDLRSKSQKNKQKIIRLKIKKKTEADN